MNNVGKGLYTLQNGKKSCFNLQSFRKAINSCAKQEGISKQDLMENLAEKVGVSCSAIKHWLQGHNAPSDLDKVQDIAIALGVNRETLLIEMKGDSEEMIKNYSEGTIQPSVITAENDTVHGMYAHFVVFIESFRSTRSTNNKCQELEILYNNLMCARLDLPGDVFAELQSFIVDYLQQMLLANEIFSAYFSVDSTMELALDDLRKSFEEYGSLIMACNDPWVSQFSLNLILSYRSNPTSQIAQLATEMVRDDWLAIEDGDPDIPYFYMENLINGAHKQLFAIFSRYKVS